MPPSDTSRPDPADDLEPLRLEVARLRRVQHLTHEGLAERSGVSRSVVIRLETGQTKGEITTWLRIARGLGVSLSDLVRVLD